MLVAGCGTSEPPIPAPTIDQARMAFEAGRSSEAEETLTSILSGSTEDAVRDEALSMMARLHHERGETSTAIDLLGEISDADNDTTRAARLMRAEWLSQQARYDEAVAAWRSLLRDNPSSPTIQKQLSLDLFRSGHRIESANMNLAALSGRRLSESELRRLIDVTQPPLTPYQESIRRRNRTSPSDSTPTTLNDVWSAIAESDFELAAQQLKSSDDRLRDPQSRALQLWVTTTLRDFAPIARQLMSDQGSVNETLEPFPSYWLALGNWLMHRERPEAALSAFTQAFHRDPTAIRTHHALVGCLLRLDRDEDARWVDERRFRLASPRESVLAVGPRQLDDRVALQTLVKDLRVLGQTRQADAWLAIARGRHPDFETISDTAASDQSARRSPDYSDPPWITSDDASDSTRRRSQIIEAAFAAITDQDRKRWTDDESIEAPGGVSAEMDRPQTLIEAGVQWRNEASRLGIDFQYRNAKNVKDRYLRLFEQLGGGVAALDFDLDGQVDLCFNQAAQTLPQIPPAGGGADDTTRLFRNLGSQFRDRTASSHVIDDRYGLAITHGDWNQDGWLDIVIGNFGRNRLLINQGDGSFVDASDRVGLRGEFMTTSLAIADVQPDGLPDLIEINYANDDDVFENVPVDDQGIALQIPGPNKFTAAFDRVFVSRPDGTMEVVVLKNDSESMMASTAMVGDAAQPGLGLVVDRIPKVGGSLGWFVANDARPNQAWTLRDGRWVEMAASIGLATDTMGRSTAAMGVAAADFDRSGTSDLVVTNWYDEWLSFYAHGKEGYDDQATAIGLATAGLERLGFGCQAIDFENDGWMDLVVGNGHVDDIPQLNQPFRMPMQFLHNRDGFFTDLRTEVDDPSSATDTFVQRAHVSRCLVRCDIDADGRNDVVVTDLLEPAAVLMNRSSSDHHFVQVRLIGTTSERDGIGAVVSVVGVDPPLTQTVVTGDGYAGRNEPLLTFGLGDDDRPVTLKIRWPNGEVQTVIELAVDRRYGVVQDHGHFADPAAGNTPEVGK